jgi:ATP synthase protein I
MKGKKGEEDTGARLRQAAMLSSVGLVLVCAIFIGYFFGVWLDKKLGTEPYLMLVFTILGIAGGFVEVFQMAAKYTRR